MVFRRRNRRTLGEWARESVYPKGGFRRAAYYLTHRLRRLPDEPHRIARGVYAGVFVSFTPLFGLHFLCAAAMAWLMRGNILAALLATFIGNPFTTPVIAYSSVKLGHYLLDVQAPLDVMSIIAAFGNAGSEIWENLRAVFSPEVTDWHDLQVFFEVIFWPYMVGGVLIGSIVSLAFYWLTIPVLRAYQALRAGKLRERLARRTQPADARGSGDDDTGTEP